MFFAHFSTRIFPTLKMKPQQSNTPILLLDPIKVESFSYFNSKIKLLINKYRHSTKNSKFIDEVFTINEIDHKKCTLKKKTQTKNTIQIENVLDGYLEEKILKNTEIFIAKKINACKINKKEKSEDKITLNARNLAPQEIKFIENNFKNPKPIIEFTNPFLFMIYRYFNHTFPDSDQNYKRKEIFRKELSFLENEYLEFVHKSVHSLTYHRSHDNSEQSADDFDDIHIKQFVKMKYSNQFIESYNDRYLYAEIYVLLRCGLLPEALKLINQFSDFFNSNDPNLKNNLIQFFNGKSLPKSEHSKLINTKCDRFKILLHQIFINDKNVTDILNTFNDLLWLKMLHSTSTKDLYANKDLKSTDECKMVLNLFCKQYQATFTTLQSKNFPAIELFFTFRSFCTELNFVRPYAEMVFSILNQFTDFDNKVQIVNSLVSRGSSGEYLNDSESFFKNDPQGINSDLNPKSFSDELKTGAFSSKNSYSNQNYQKSTNKLDGPLLVAKLLIQSGNLDLLGLKKEICQIHPSIVSQVSQLLEKRGDTTNLIRLYFLFNNDTKILKILNDYLINTILQEKTEISEFKDVIEYFLVRNSSFEKDRLVLLVELLYFSINSDLNRLKCTELFTKSNLDLISTIKPVIVKLLNHLVSAITQTDDTQMGQELLLICNGIGIGERCRAIMGQGLIFML